MLCAGAGDSNAATSRPPSANIPTFFTTSPLKDVLPGRLLRPEVRRPGSPDLHRERRALPDVAPVVDLDVVADRLAALHALVDDRDRLAGLPEVRGPLLRTDVG